MAGRPWARLTGVIRPPWRARERPDRLPFLPPKRRFAKNVNYAEHLADRSTRPGKLAVGRALSAPGPTPLENHKMLKRSLLAAGLVALVGSSLAAGVAEARPPRADKDGWEQLGCVRVSRSADRDIIAVGRREGRFKAIKLKALGNDVEVLDLKVIYGNGQPDDIQVRSFMKEGSETRAIDLKGRDRFIKQVVIASKKDTGARPGNRRGRAQICAFGLQDIKHAGGPGPGPGGGKWEQLGCQKVGFLVDRDVIKVGRREGRFKAIRLEVSGNDVFINDLKVVYGNGQPDDIPVRAKIKQGGMSGPLDLKGGDRFIDRIEMVYRAKPSFKGSARVCVSGRN